MEQLIARSSSSATTGRAELTFDELYRDCRDDLHAYVAGLLRDRSAAEEVTATAFERAYRRRRTYDRRRGSGRAWLFGIARNAALDELRRRGRQAELAAEPADPELPDAGESAELALRRAALREALERLDGRARELIALKFFAGLSNAEIGSVLGITASHVGTRLHRVMEQLRRSMR